MPDTTTLSDAVLRSLTTARALRPRAAAPADTLPCSTPFSAVAFHPSGSAAVLTNTADASLHVLDCTTGDLHRSLLSKKYGAAHARFTHHRNNLIYASTAQSDAIRYMSIHDNKYLRYFSGHTARVSALDVHPHNDTFISASRDDGSVRLWDLRMPAAVHRVDIPPVQGAQPDAVAWDPTGTVFCVAAGRELRMYSVADLAQGPFAIIRPDAVATARWTAARFSPTGQHVLLTDSLNAHLVIDAFSGALIRTLKPPALHTEAVAGVQAPGAGGETAWSPDGKYVFCTYGEDGAVVAWPVPSIDDLTGSNRSGIGPVLELPGLHRASDAELSDASATKTGVGLTQIAWNPKMALMVTAATDVVCCAFGCCDNNALSSYSGNRTFTSGSTLENVS